MDRVVPSRKTVLLTAVALLAGALVVAAMLTKGSRPEAASAASHREAPLISLDPTADITDFYFFRSYEPGQKHKTVMIMDVYPGEEPSSGPNYFNFDPEVTYAFNIDDNKDGKAEDVRFEITFENEIRGTVAAAKLPLAFVAVPPIEHLDGPGSEGLGVRQKYTVTMYKGDENHVLGSGLIAVPSNVGPRTMPNYQQLVTEGTYNLDGGARVFAGQRDDPFYIDLGAVFDTLNLRSPLSTPPSTDMLSGFNVQSIALEVPTTWLNGDTGETVLGAYANTYRPRVTVRGGDGDEDEDEDERRSSGKVQVQRLANPLVNELIIGTVDKDEWNATEPHEEKEFLDYYLKPRVALAFELVFGASTACTFPAVTDCKPAMPPASAPKNLDTFNRTDLVQVLLKYGPKDRKLSELLRLDTRVEPTPLANQKRLTVLAGDSAGWPNGRRPIDDVTDIAIKVVGGPNFFGAGDGVDANDDPFPNGFPFLSTPANGFDLQPNPHDVP